jgi:hypothetical protein
MKMAKKKDVDAAEAVEVPAGVKVKEVSRGELVDAATATVTSLLGFCLKEAEYAQKDALKKVGEDKAKIERGGYVASKYAHISKIEEFLKLLGTLG